jgi:hypothetical protein
MKIKPINKKVYNYYIPWEANSICFNPIPTGVIEFIQCKKCGALNLLKVCKFCKRK